ncbi:nucleotide sugar dehydrogenase [uncultured Thiothrix sp.]|jgi:UDP-N-acetyl-D-galactosamine dehydrogenase|uniref:nucleotide sugar dehydrogenase n=1 Tax=uncultured Thiothrix sp. TaxID=223185 RepID=UPI00260BCF31|nr:nucleotide sugar dehydrogenase [uncultured Thiothrix sp.]HMT94502.1 nucleotide sugar dehydrogenase [Thiolinea sp.]
MKLVNKSIIAIIGLGYVGLPLAIEFGKTITTIGFDINQNRIQELNAGNDRTLEVTTEELKASKNLTYTDQLEHLRQANIFIITVPTPVDEHKRPDLSPLLKASESVGKIIKKGDIVIYESTVYPGATEEDCIPLIERVSKLTFNKDFFAGYSPERINPGDKVNRLTTIKKITSGSTPETADFIDDLYKTIIKAGTHKAPSIKVAEAAKIIENTQRDLNISLMNELSIIFSRMGIDTLSVLEAAGTKWNFLPFRPGLVGGHCISVDPYYLTDKAEKLGYIPQVILAGRRINDNMGRYVARTTVKKMIQNGVNPNGSRVGVLGITFKENCPDIRNSKVIDIVRELEDFGVIPVVSDPWANPVEVADEYNGLTLTDLKPQTPVDALIVAVAHDQFVQLTPQVLHSLLRGNKPVIADVKSLYDTQALEALHITTWRL